MLNVGRMKSRLAASLLFGILAACTVGDPSAPDPASGDGHEEVTFSEQVHAMPVMGADTHQGADGVIYSWLTAGFLGTLAMTTVTRAASELGLTRMDVPFLLGTSVTENSACRT